MKLLIPSSYCLSEKKPLPPPYSNKRARARWFLMYTLYNNPSLRAYRKQYLAFIREMQERLAQRYNLSGSALGDLMSGITTVMGDANLSDVNISVSENGDILSGPNMMNMNAMVAMSRFMLALQRDVVQNGDAHKDSHGPSMDFGSVFGRPNPAASDENVAPVKGLWKRAAGKAYVQSQMDKQRNVNGSPDQSTDL